jgi:hypothetical protein
MVQQLMNLMNLNLRLIILIRKKEMKILNIIIKYLEEPTLKEVLQMLGLVNLINLLKITYKLLSIMVCYQKNKLKILTKT